MLKTVYIFVKIGTKNRLLISFLILHLTDITEPAPETGYRYTGFSYLHYKMPLPVLHSPVQGHE